MNETIILTVTNSIQYYDTASYTSAKINEFNGIKGLRVAYDNSIDFTDATTSIDKKALSVWCIMSDGSEVPLADEKELETIAVSYTPKQADDINFKVTDNGGAFLVTSEKDYVHNSVYTLTATYKGISCNFDIRFAQTPIDASKKEITLIFKTDDENRCYFTDGTQNFNTYSLVYMITGEDATNVKILHDGQTVLETKDVTFEDGVVKINNSKLFTVCINEAFAGEYELDGWNPEIPSLDDIKTSDNHKIIVKIKTKKK